MRILYVTRQFNRSGYATLQHLLEQTDFQIAAVVVPPMPSTRGRAAWLDAPLLSTLERARYRAEVAYYRGQNLRFEKSLSRLLRTGRTPIIELTTLRSREAADVVWGVRPDLLVVGGGWPGRIPPEVLGIAPLGAINSHPSLLPEFRGTDVHRWQVLAGVRASGVAVHYMDEGFDTGGILGCVAVPLDGSETPQALAEKTARVAGPLVEKVVSRIAANAPNRVVAEEQSDRDDTAKYFSKWPWNDIEMLRINWSSHAVEIERLVRAASQESYQFHGPTFSACGVRYILRRASVVNHAMILRPGEICVRDDKLVLVGTRDIRQAVGLDVVQPFALVPNRNRAQNGPWFGSRMLARGCMLMDSHEEGIANAAI